MSELRYKRRLLVLAMGIFFLFALLVVQFYRIQVIQGSYWTRVADGQHYLFINEPFMRGAFFANDGDRRLTVDIQKYHLYADPLSIPMEHRKAVVGWLSSRYDLEPAWLDSQLSRRSRSRKLKPWMDRSEHDELLSWWRLFAKQHRIASNALYFVKDYQRSYPYDHLLGQVLHTIQDNKDEVTKQARPTGGLELQFNEELKGKLGKKRLVRSPRNAFEMGKIIEEPENGADVYLSIDVVLQAICEEEVSKAAQEVEAKSGWAVMMDPGTGEVLAMAQYPFFNPSNYKDYYNSPEKIEATKVKAITDAYEPGSTIKPLTMALALEANLEGEFFDPEEKVPCTDGRFPGRSKPISDVRVHPYLNMYMAMQKSSNIYMARIVDRMIKSRGEDWYRNGLRDYFGIGVPTKIELPAESYGVLPRPGSAASGWSTAAPYSMAFGYNLQVTSMQMLRAFAILANGGYWVDPTLVRKVVKRHDDETEMALFDATAERTAPGKRVLSPETVQKVLWGMKYATKTGGGARRGDIPGYTQAGKTGTSKKIIEGAYSSESYFATFVGFAPVNNPRFVLLVAIDEPARKFRPGQGMTYYGGVCAAPVFRKIGRRALEYLGETPDDPFGYPVGDPRYDSERADWISEVSQLNALYAEWNGS